VLVNKGPGENTRPKKRSWTIRLANIAGGAIVTLVIIWQTGIMSKGWWEWFPAPKPTVVAKAPARPPSKVSGIARLIPKGNDSSSSPVPLQLVLVRVQPGRTVQEGLAQMGVVRETPQTYQAGALLENGARLAEIHTDYVLLQKEGRSARLYLENAATARKVGDTTILMVGGPKAASPPTKITTREILTDYMIGYQVYPGAISGPYYQMGLQPGDVIVEIDGTPLTDPASAWGMFRQLADGNVLSAVVKRRNGIEQLSLDGTMIARAEEAKAQQPAQAMLTPGPQ
jgi:membrane-associated protease RseP (regulator of RpoE activity)